MCGDGQQSPDRQNREISLEHEKSSCPEQCVSNKKAEAGVSNDVGAPENRITARYGASSDAPAPEGHHCRYLNSEISRFGQSDSNRSLDEMHPKINSGYPSRHEIMGRPNS